MKPPFARAYDFRAGYARYRRHGLARPIGMPFPLPLRALWISLPLTGALGVSLLDRGWRMDAEVLLTWCVMVYLVGLAIHYLLKTGDAPPGRRRPMMLEREGIFFFALEELFAWERVGFAWMRRDADGAYDVILLLKQTVQDAHLRESRYNTLCQALTTERNVSGVLSAPLELCALSCLQQGAQAALTEAAQTPHEPREVDVKEDIARVTLRLVNARQAAQFLEVVNTQICRAVGLDPQQTLLSVDDCLNQAAFFTPGATTLSNLRALAQQSTDGAARQLIPDAPNEPAWLAAYPQERAQRTLTELREEALHRLPLSLWSWSKLALVYGVGLLLWASYAPLLLGGAQDPSGIGALLVVGAPLAYLLFLYRGMWRRAADGVAAFHRDGVFLLEWNDRLPWNHISPAWSHAQTPQFVYLFAQPNRGRGFEFWKLICGDSVNRFAAIRNLDSAPRLAALTALQETLAEKPSPLDKDTPPAPEEKPAFIALPLPQYSALSAAQLADRINQERQRHLQAVASPR
ncbi:hypothetical protein [Magnetofaba australis]|uniref:Uncharacterized protein n=1 Tax=Magnetofaba australis IT-1 TaxID=1434232 RepID=A0A1Y2K8E0_9PROT|nr:hypothetical protein [Magnetofaba australis]OSM06889.1 hypothetical protein MAIT1_00230 [Magnetofaba australis IT-1]